MKPCPFCGSSRLENLDAAQYGGAVHCIDCGARGPIPERLERKLSRDVGDGLDAWEVETRRRVPPR